MIGESEISLTKENENSNKTDDILKELKDEDRKLEEEKNKYEIYI